MSDLSNERFSEWGIVEVLGHHKYVGYVTEAVIGGSAMVRVDVPECPPAPARGYRDAQPAIPAYTKYFGAGSIFAITPISEEYARAAVAQLRAVPHNIYIPQMYPPEPPRALEAGPQEDDLFGDDEEEDEVFQ